MTILLRTLNVVSMMNCHPACPGLPWNRSGAERSARRFAQDDGFVVGVKNIRLLVQNAA
jgi:hypothetical protein